MIALGAALRVLTAGTAGLWAASGVVALSRSDFGWAFLSALLAALFLRVALRPGS